MKKSRFLTVCMLSVMPMFYLFCGGSTEVGNARSNVTGSISKDNKKAIGAVVRLVEENFVPGSDTTNKVFTTESNSFGEYHFTDIPTGSYYLNAQKFETMLLAGPFTIEKENETLENQALCDPSALAINVSADEAVTVVYVKGTITSHQVVEGVAELSEVPKGTITIIGYSFDGKAPDNIINVSSKRISVAVNEGNAVVASFSNEAPQIARDVLVSPQVVTTAERSYTYVITATDSENDELRFTMISGPPQMTIDSITGKVTWNFDVTVLPGRYRVAVAVQDARGSENRISWEVIVTDFTPVNPEAPVIILYGGDTVEIMQNDPDGVLALYLDVSNKKLVQAIDPQGSQVTITQTNNVDVFTSNDKQSPYTVTYTARDDEGNNAVKVRYVNIVNTPVVDTVPPLLAIADSVIYMYVHQPYVEPGYEAYDLGDGSKVDVVIEGVVDTTKAGVNIITYTATDSKGNSISKTRMVVVADVNNKNSFPPVILLTYMDSTILHVRNTVWKEPGFSVVDAQDGTIPNSNVVVDSSNLITNIGLPGVYIIKYSVTNSRGLSSSVERKVAVVNEPEEKSAPHITLMGADTLALNEGESIEAFKVRYVEPGYSATDAIDGDITAHVTVSQIAEENPSMYYISYNVTNSNGIAARTVTRFIKTGVTDPNIYPPVIILTYGDSVILHQKGQPWREPGFSVSDAQDGSIPNSNVTVDSSNLVAHLDSLGEYVVTYMVSNSLGLTTIKKRYVQVAFIGNAQNPPVITLLGRNPDTCLAQHDYVDPGYTAVDAADGDVTADVVSAGTVNSAKFGKYTLSYTVQDNAGNRSEAVTRTVWVVPDTNATNLLVRYNVPSLDSALPAINETFTKYIIDGDGLSLDETVIKEIRFNWRPKTDTAGSLLQFSITYNETPFFQSFDAITQSFDGPGAAMTLTGTSIAGLDGEYYVTVYGEQLIWVRKDGSYAILFSK